MDVSCVDVGLRGSNEEGRVSWYVGPVNFAGRWPSGFDETGSVREGPRAASGKSDVARLWPRLMERGMLSGRARGRSPNVFSPSFVFALSDYRDVDRVDQPRRSGTLRNGPLPLCTVGVRFLGRSAKCGTQYELPMMTLVGERGQQKET